MSTELMLLEETTASAANALDAVQAASAGQEDQDLALCCVCLQWTCDGPQCHRPGVCED